MSHQYVLCFISQVLIGFGASGISTLPGQVSHQRFGANQWALATSLMLMANYSGWLFGSSVPEAIVVPGSAESLRSLFFAQAVYSLVPVLAFFAFYRPLPEDAARVVDAENAEKPHLDGFIAVFRVMASTPQFALQLLTHGLFGAIGFVMPSAILFILEDLDTPEVLGRIINAAWIGTGVLGGILLGAFSTDASTYPRTLKTCYIVGTAALALLCAVAYSDELSGIFVSISLVLLSGAAGFATLGFTGVLFEDLARFPGMTSSYVLWIGYEVMLAISSLLNLLASNASGFWTLAGTCLVTCFTFLSFYRQADEAWAKLTTSTEPSLSLTTSTEGSLPTSADHKPVT